MNAIRFNTIVGDDQVIRPPAGVSLPTGPLEVTVMPAAVPAQEDKDIENLRNWLLAMAAEAEKNPADLPVDLAENHDFYIHGKPRE